MSVQSRQTSKLSTLEAARAIYFIIAGLAIRQSLGIFAHSWQQDGTTGSANLWGWDERLLVGIGYLITVLRFSHGISLLHGHEKERIENSTLPSSRRISLLSLFLVLIAIFLYMMADNIAQFRAYVVFASIVLITDLAYILASGVVRYPIIRPLRVWGQTSDGYPARAALQWMVSDLILLALCCLLLFHPSLTKGQHEQFFGSVLIAAGLFDYYMNRSLYFGSKEDKRKHKFVFVCSPLSSNGEEGIKSNINRAQAYCHSLMKECAPVSGKEITPYASHCFYTYFLDDTDAEDRIIGRECAISYLHVCDAIYVYVPYSQGLLRKYPNLRNTISSGMQHEIQEAKQLGLEITYKDLDEELPVNWKQPYWSSPKIKVLHRKLANTESDDEKSEAIYEGRKLRKRVYVCTMLRGIGFDELNPEEKAGRLKENIRKTLWRCYQLAKEGKDGDVKLAPFAPQAFFPYFWKFISNGKIDEGKWNDWFKRSIEVLKVCDSVYIYTTDGLPQTAKNISDGMREVIERAEHLGLDIKYLKETAVPAIGDWEPALPDFPFARSSET